MRDHPTSYDHPKTNQIVRFWSDHFKKKMTLDTVLNLILVCILLLKVLFFIVPLRPSDHVKAYAAGDETYYVLSPNGDLIGWGTNDHLVVGTGTFIIYPYIARKTILRHVSSMDVGYHCAMAVDKDGGLWGWGGSNDILLLEDSDEWKTIGNRPVKIMDDIASVSLGTFYAAAVKTDGTLLVWGRDVLKKQISRPLSIMGDVKFVFAGSKALFAIDTKGALYCWCWDRQVETMTGGPSDSLWLAANIAEVSYGGAVGQYQLRTTDGDVKVFDLDNGIPEIDELPVAASDVRELCNGGVIKSDTSFWSWALVNADNTGSKEVVLTKQMEHVAAAANQALLIDSNGRIYAGPNIGESFMLPHNVATVSPILRNAFILALIIKFIYSSYKTREKQT